MQHVKQSNGWVSDGQGPGTCTLEEETEGQEFVQPLEETLLQPAPIYGKVGEKSQLQRTRIANWSGIFWENIKIRVSLWGKLCIDTLPKETVGDLFSEVFKAQVNQALCNITWCHGWPYFEQEAADFPRSLPTWTVLFSIYL